MGKQKVKPLLTCFTQEGDYLAILSPDGTAKIWSTSTGSLFAECKQSDGNPAETYSCMACSFIGKKRKKEHGTCLLAFGTNEGEIFAIDVLAGDRKWKSTGCYLGGIAGLSFSNKGHSLYVIGNKGKASEINSETGYVIREFKASKRSISSLTFSQDGKYLALASGKIRILSLEDGKELLKFSDDLDAVQYISMSNNAKTIVTSGFGDTNLQVWSCDLSSKSVSGGSVISMSRPPLAFECNDNGSEDGGCVILAVSESGIASVWNFETLPQDDVKPTKITLKADKAEGDQQKSASSKKSRISVITARLHASGMGQQVVAHIAYGPLDSPQFSLVNVSKTGENIVINAVDPSGNETIQENRAASVKGLQVPASTTAVDPNGKPNKKRAAPDPDLATTRGVNDTGHGENVDGVLVDDDLNEPTMGEKLASLNLVENGKTETHEKQEKEESSPSAKPPTADSVNVLLKQALHADDRVLLLDCLYTQDEKVITNSVSQLNPSDVLKLLQSLISIIQSRGAVLACALPWIKSLLLQHSSGIMSQQSSLLALNSLYQLIESRVSTFESALQISSCLDLLHGGIVEDDFDENATVPVMFEDKDESDEEEESEDAMDTDQENEDGEALDEAFDGVSDFEGFDDMSE